MSDRPKFAKVVRPSLDAYVTSAIDAAATRAIDAVLQDVYTESSEHEQEFRQLRDVSPAGWPHALDQLPEDRYDHPGPLSFDAALAVLVASAQLLGPDAKEGLRDDLDEIASLVWPRAVVARALLRVEMLLEGFPPTDEVAPGAFEHALFSLRKLLTPVVPSAPPSPTSTEKTKPAAKAKETRP